FSVLSDGVTNPEETVAFERLVVLLGQQAYGESARLATELAPNEESLRDLLLTVENQDARELIYETVFEVAASETINLGEARFLDLAGKLWDIKPSFEGFPSE